MSDLTVDPEIVAILAPIQEKVSRLDSEIDELQSEIESRREERRRFERILRAADPNGKPGPKSKQAKTSGDWTASERSVDLAYDFLVAHKAELPTDGFYASQLERDYADEIGMSGATITKALRVLHERGLIRLVKTGNGGARIYKLVGK